MSTSNDSDCCNREYGQHIVLNHTACCCEKSIEKYTRLTKMVLLKASVPLPATFSLASRYKLNILDQGNIGSCVVNAFAAIMQSLYNVTPSRLYYYFNGRVATGNSPVDDSGLDILQSYPFFQSFGVVPETSWSYNTNMFSVMPPYSLYKNANVISCTFKNVSQTDLAIKSAIFSNGFVMFGFMVYSSFMTNSVASTGIIPTPDTKTETNLGGHCVHLVGWTKINNISYYIIRNSWGLGWGNDGAAAERTTTAFKNNGINGGFAYMPATYVLNPALSFEFLSVSK